MKEHIKKTIQECNENIARLQNLIENLMLLSVSTDRAATADADASGIITARRDPPTMPRMLAEPGNDKLADIHQKKIDLLMHQIGDLID